MNISMSSFTFTETPTPSQVALALREAERFFSQVAGALLLEGRHVTAEPKMSNLLNATVQMRAAIMAFDGNMPGIQSAGPSLVGRQ